MRSLALVILAPLCLAWNAGGTDTLAREIGEGKAVTTVIRDADGIASWVDDGLHVMITQRAPDGGAAVVGIWIPSHRVFARRGFAIDHEMWLGYTEYGPEGSVRFQDGDEVEGSIRVDVDESRGAQLSFSVRLVDDFDRWSWRLIEAEGFWMPALSEVDAPHEAGSPGGGVSVGVDGYYGGYDDDDYESGGCDGDDWGGSDSGDDWGSDDGGGCDGDDWDSGGDSGGGCDGDDLGGGDAPSCDCEGDALAGPRGPGQPRRSPWVMRAFNWAPWCLVFVFIQAMKRRRRFSATSR